MWIEYTTVKGLKGMLNSNTIECVQQCDNGKARAFVYMEENSSYMLDMPYEDVVSVLNGDTVRLFESVSVQVKENMRLTQENEMIRRQMQHVLEANVELRKDNMREFQAGLRHSDPHVRTALGSAILALEGIRDGKTDASQFDSSVFAAACLDQVAVLLAEGEAQAKKQHDEQLQRDMESL